MVALTFDGSHTLGGVLGSIRHVSFIGRHMMVCYLMDGEGVGGPVGGAGAGSRVALSGACQLVVGSS